jgi:hypothetical protein
MQKKLMMLVLLTTLIFNCVRKTKFKEPLSQTPFVLRDSGLLREMRTTPTVVTAKVGTLVKISPMIAVVKLVFEIGSPLVD